jgi:hypothetical protein
VVLIDGLTGVRSSAHPRFAPTFTFCHIRLTGALIYIKPRRFYFFLFLSGSSPTLRRINRVAQPPLSRPLAPPPCCPAPPPPPCPPCAARRPSPPPHLLAVAPGRAATTALLCSHHRCTTTDQPPCSPSIIQSPPPRAISASLPHPLSYVAVPSRAAVTASSN